MNHVAVGAIIGAAIYIVTWLTLWVRLVAYFNNENSPKPSPFVMHAFNFIRVCNSILIGIGIYALLKYIIENWSVYGY